MVGFFGLLFVSLASAFAMIWLIGYAPIYSKFVGIKYSPRLMICKLLIPIDVTMTSIMVLGPWIIGGGGLGHVILSTFTGLGLTAGTVLIRKFFVPKWRKLYLQECSARQAVRALI